MKADTEIISVNDLKRLIARYEECYPDGLYFRGESMDYPTRKPSIDRNPRFLANEPRLYQEAVSIHHLSGDTISNLSIMQHYGVPTRLTDLTIDPLYALYFACEGNDDEPGYVFMYIPKQTVKNKQSHEVRALSLLAKEEVNGPEDLAQKYYDQYGEDVTIDQLIKWCAEPVIIQYDESLHENNERMRLQHGAFAICGSDISVLPERKIKSIDSIPPVRVFVVSPEYKAAIRKELKANGIAQHAVYPELTETAKSLKEKYGSDVKPLFQEADYEIIEEEIRRKGFFCDMSLTILIKKHLPVDAIKAIIYEACKQYQDKVSVIYIFIALSNEDYITKNWLLRGKWIKPGFSFGAITPLKIRDDIGYSWDFTGGARIRSEWNEERSFGDDKIQLRRYLATYNHITTEVNLAKRFFELVEAGIESDKPLMPITAKAIMFDFKFSRNKGLDDYFKQLDTIFTTAHNILMEVNKDYSGLRGNELRQALILYKMYLKTYEKEQIQIENGRQHWIDEIGITENEIANADPVKGEQYVIPSFKRKIPVSDCPIEVKMSVTGCVSDDGRALVRGETNLSDGAKLMVRLDDGATDHVMIYKGMFQCTLGANGSCKRGERHHITVILTAPNTQDIGFLKWAGMEYENLTGDIMDYTFLSPVGEFESDVIL